LQQGGIATEAIHDEAFDARLLRGRQTGQRADEMGEHAAAVDVADEPDRDVDRLGEAHVRDVARAQVHFRRAARAFDDQPVELARQPRPRSQHGIHRHALVVVIRAGIEVGDGPAVDDHLRAPVGGGFQQHRVEVVARRQPRGLRLQGLRAADLAALDGDRRIERHVLRLERRDAQPPPMQDAA
jgi:hypothetical protein